MKQLFFSALLFLAVVSISACNNGPYDADPKTDNTAVPNWLDAKYAQSYGEIKCKVNGEWQSFWGNYSIANGQLIVSGSYTGDNGAKFYGIGFVVDNYGGAKQYNINTPTAYAMLSYGKNNTAIDSTFESDNWGSGKLNIITETKEGVLYGTFDFTARKTTPNNDTSRKITITEGSFKVRK